MARAKHFARADILESVDEALMTAASGWL